MLYEVITEMIQDKKSPKRAPSGACTIHCQDCSISQLCIPFTLNEQELDQLDNIIERKKPIQKGETLRITSYNVCYTKLLRDGCGSRPRPPRCA